MPPNALEILSRMNVMFPMLFSLFNSKTKRKTHCGVLEFVAEPGRIYLPHWMMQNLLLADGDSVHVTNLTLPACSFAKIKPASVDFLDISNPKGTLTTPPLTKHHKSVVAQDTQTYSKAVLENCLRNFACLTKDDIIAMSYNNKVG